MSIHRENPPSRHTIFVVGITHSGCHKISQIGTSKKINVIGLKLQWFGFVAHPKDTTGIANSVGPDRSSLIRMFTIGSELFVQYLKFLHIHGKWICFTKSED